MFPKVIAAVLISLLGVASASPIPQNDSGSNPTKITPDIVLAAAPGTTSCNGSGSCRTAAQAAPFIQAAFGKFGFKTKGEQAAILALMAFESGDFKFDVNVFPGRPGQGTRNMMTFPFIYKYALESPEVAGQVASIAPGLNPNMSFDQLNQTPPNVMNGIRALVLRDDLSFASAAWFLRTKCSPDIATGLATATAAAWSKYMTVCVGTSDAPERLTGYQKALHAYGL